jgi:hypothetical protein
LLEFYSKSLYIFFAEFLYVFVTDHICLYPSVNSIEKGRREGTKNAPVKLLIQTKFAPGMAKMAPLFAMTIQRLTRQPKKPRLASITSPLLEYG